MPEAVRLPENLRKRSRVWGDLRADWVEQGGMLQKIFRCKKCQRGMRVVGSTGLAKPVERVVMCPYCKTKNKVEWPRGDPFRVQKIATR